MNEHPRHLDHETAEQLLSGTSPTHAAGSAHLARLLAAAGGPPRPWEYEREDEAVAAFRAAGLTPRRRLGWRRLLTFKVLAVTGVVTVGGLAFASTTGIIPAPFKDDLATGAQPAVSTTSAPHRSSAAAGTPAPSSSPQANAFNGLCNSYLARDEQERRKALKTPAFAELVTAAGGEHNVEAYCAQVPDKEKPEKPPTPKPSHEPNAPNAPRSSRVTETGPPTLS